LLWYLFGVFLPMATLFIRSPIYTRIFSPELYGKYTMVYITYTYLSAIFFQWITSSAWRYFKKYTNQLKTETYSQTLIRLYLLTFLILTIITFIWYHLTQDSYQRKLIFMGFLYASTQEMINTLLVPMRMKAEAKKYNLINGLRAVTSFLILLLLTFIYNYTIEAFFLAPLIINVILLISLIFNQKKYLYRLWFHKEKNLSAHSKRFYRYGLTTLVFTTCIFLLATSDRYIILLSGNYNEVGIYNQTYNIANMSIAAILMAINAALNPLLLNSLETKPNKSDELLSRLLLLAMYIGLPFTIIFSILSKHIAQLLLGPEFRSAYLLMPFIFLSALLFGASHFASVKLKFKNMFRQLMLSSGIVTCLNILLNLWWVPLYGYEWAAVSTLLSYLLFAILLFYSAKINPFKSSKIRHSYLIIVLGIIAVFISHILFHRMLRQFQDSSLFAIVEGVILLAIFALVTWNISPINKKNISGYVQMD
jgi:O-antigen/teichoic acid export membrane protein